MHLSPPIDGVDIPKSVRQMQYSGVIQGIKGYLAQMDHSPGGEDIQMTTSGIERDTDTGVDAGNESVIRGDKSALAKPELASILKVLDSLRAGSLVAEEASSTVCKFSGTSPLIRIIIRVVRLYSARN